MSAAHLRRKTGDLGTVLEQQLHHLQVSEFHSFDVATFVSSLATAWKSSLCARPN
jgi:hypothetical protein